MSRPQNSVVYLTVREFLASRHLSGRLCAWQTAVLVGCETRHIPVLIAAKLLKPLGNPPANAPKYFPRDRILELSSDERWLARVSDALVAHWSKRNAKKSKKSAGNKPLP